MQTEKCYERDSYLKTLDAVVLDCRTTNRGYGIILDRTCFFPEGGGQPADRGTLTGEPVLDVQIVDNEILHYTSKPLAIGTSVTAQIDWERRFDLMQQHSGEHIVSGIVHRLYGYDNVGFHMGERITVDWNGILTEAQLQKVEDLTNAAIWKNRSVEVSYLTDENFAHPDYRSKKELTGQVRLVTYPEVDVCACCGTHVARTGEIGLAKILSVQKFRSGVRVEMIFGQRAIAHCNQILAENHKTSMLLSAKEYQTASAVERLFQETQTWKTRCVQLEQSWFQVMAEAHQGEENPILFAEGLSSDGVRRLAIQLMEHGRGRCAVFSGSDIGGYQYAVGENGGDLRLWTKELNQALHGRGGGKPFFVQGAVQATEEEIRAFFTTGKE